MFRSYLGRLQQESLVPTMNEHSDKLLPHIEVDPAIREHATILANLLELYAHDFSEFHNFDLGPDGRFV